MAYGNPTHGPWCNTRTWPTRCRYCSEKVFFYTCSHGSKVFFDELGWPWPLHQCDEYCSRHHNIIRNFGETISSDYCSTVRANHESRKTVKLHECKRRDPAIDDLVADFGQLKEYIEHLDIRKKLKIDGNTAMATAFLGELAKGDFAQMTVHTGDLSKSDTTSYTFLVHRILLSSIDCERFDVIEFKLRAYNTPGKKIIWLCDSIKSSM